jgi:hypothetical protein
MIVLLPLLSSPITRTFTCKKRHAVPRPARSKHAPPF